MLSLMLSAFDSDPVESTIVSQAPRILHTAQTRTTGGRSHGVSRSSDGRMDIRLALPGSDRIGINSEHLFAAAWSACFETAIELAAERMKLALPADVTIDAEIDLKEADGSYFLSARLSVSLPGIDRAVAQKIIDEAHQTCPYSKATRGNIDVAISLI